MKLSISYALSEIRRRPRGFIALTAVSASILTILIMMLLFLNASWRAEVMPDNEQNYHFYIRGLTDSEKRYVASQPWVQAWYDIDITGPDGKLIDSTFRVRVIWPEVVRVSKHAWEIFDELNLWSREEYKTTYDSYYKDKLNGIIADYHGAPAESRLSTGYTIAETAMIQAKHKLLMSSKVKNVSFCQLSIDSYIIRPEFFAMMMMFALFLGSAMMILMSESYKRLTREFGTLRALGMKKRQIAYIFCAQNLFSSLAAIPLGAAASILVVKLYTAIYSGRLDAENVYLTLLDSIPVSVILIMSALMTIASLAGCIAVCVLNRNLELMSMLSGATGIRVSFVAKTSPRFERAKSARIYNRLRLGRTKRSFILSVLVIVIMLPLPLSYLLLMITPEFGAAAPEGEFAYYLFQTIILYLTSMIVIYVSSRSGADERAGEYGILRSMGMKKRGLRNMIFHPYILQILFTCIPSVLLFLKLSDTTQRTSALPGAARWTPVGFISTLLFDSAGVILLIAPPLFLGAALALRRFGRRSTIENIRDC